MIEGNSYPDGIPLVEKDALDFLHTRFTRKLVMNSFSTEQGKHEKKSLTLKWYRVEKIASRAAKAQHSRSFLRP